MPFFHFLSVTKEKKGKKVYLGITLQKREQFLLK